MGINYDKYEFYAAAGTQYNYIPGREPMVEHTNTPGKGITYKQRFVTPYLGFILNYSPNTNWDISWGLKGSFWGRAKIIDRHLLRGQMESVEKYKRIKSLSSQLEVKYHWNESLSITLGLEAINYFKNKNSTTRFTPENVTEKTPIQTVKGLGGVKNRNISYSLGLEYKF